MTAKTKRRYLTISKKLHNEGKHILKKITRPIFDQLKQGVTPEKLALSIAFGVVIGILPVFGVTTSLCILAAFLFRLNHVAIQTVNYIAYPLQIALLVPFIYSGERIYSYPSVPLNAMAIVEQFKMNFGLALKKYFLLGMMGATAWLILAPFIFMIIYFSSKILLTKLIKQQA